MRYFEEHRRKLIKSKKMIGALSTVSASEGEELRLRNCSGEIVSLSLEGNTVQDGTPEFIPSSTEQVSETYTESFVPITQADWLLKGFDEEYASLYTDSYPVDIFSKFPSNADSITLTLESVGLTKFAGLTVAISSTWSANPSDYKNLYSCSSIDAGVTENYSDITINKADYPNGIYISIGDTLAGLTSTTEQICKEWWKVLTIIATTVVVTSITTPATIIPAPIINAGDGGLDVELSGANLYNIAKVNGAALTSTSTPDKPSSATYGTITNGIMHLRYSFYAQGTIWTGAKIPIEKAGNYYFSCEVLAETSSSTKGFYAQLVNKTKNVSKTRTFTPLSYGVWTIFPVGAFTIPQEWIGDDVYLSLQPQGNATQYTSMPCYAKNVMITFGEHTDYEPYFSNKLNIPSEVTLTDGTVVPLRFAKLGTVNNIAINKADTLTIDRGKVTYTQYLDVYQPKAPYVSDLAYYSYSDTGVRFNTLLPNAMTRRNGINSHGGKVGDYYGLLDVWVGVRNTSVWWQGIVSKLGFNSNWADRTSPTNEERAEAISQMEDYFATQEANGTPFQVLYELPTPIEYNLTSTDLGKQLLALAIPYGNDGIITFDSDGLLPSAVKCEYETIDDTLEDKLSLTIFYKDTEGNELAPSQVHLLRKGTSFSVVPIDITGYMSMGSYEGVIKEDTEITIEYLGGSNESV